MSEFKDGETLNYHVNGSKRNVWKVIFLVDSLSGKRCKVRYMDGAPKLLYGRNGWVSAGALRRQIEVKP